VASAEEIRCGIVGPGRTRNGLGPFLARQAERAGMRVVAASGRDVARTREATAALGRGLGHPVEPFANVDAMLAAPGLDCLIIASPADAHRAALEVALAHGVHVLCEKPLVAFEDAAAVDGICDGFVSAGRVLLENCVWPCALAGFDELHPGRRRPARRVAMGLSPVGAGRAMVEDSLSHVLSVVQAVAEVGDGTEARSIAYSTRDRGAEACVLEFGLGGATPAVDVRFELTRCERQPRPAWLEVDGARADRRVRLEDYAISLVAGGREVRIDDPLGLLVYGFADRIREPDVERIRTDTDAIRHRARLYRELVSAW
jgi:hypothetical protein